MLIRPFLPVPHVRPGRTSFRLHSCRDLICGISGYPCRHARRSYFARITNPSILGLLVLPPPPPSSSSPSSSSSSSSSPPRWCQPLRFPRNVLSWSVQHHGGIIEAAGLLGIAPSSRGSMLLSDAAGRADLHDVRIIGAFFEIWAAELVLVQSCGSVRDDCSLVLADLWALARSKINDDAKSLGAHYAGLPSGVSSVIDKQVSQLIASG